MKRAILLGPMGVSDPSLKECLRALGSRPDDLRIGIDGGTELWLKLNRSPDLAIGDWDSLKSKVVLKQLDHITLPRKKDLSDLAFALRAAFALGAREIACLGVTGGRADHHLASLLDLASIAKKGVRVCAFGPCGDYHFLSSKGTKRLILPKGRRFSIFALGGCARKVTLKGMEYGLKRASLSPSSRGLSNQVTALQGVIEVESGNLLVVIPKSLY